MCSKLMSCGGRAPTVLTCMRTMVSACRWQRGFTSPAFSSASKHIRQTIVAAMDNKLPRNALMSEVVYGVLRVLSLAYSAGMWARKMAYKARLLRAHVLPVPVISVGNVTVGGSGKTPMCIFLARLARENGLRPLVLTRGYGQDEDKMMMKLLDGIAGLGSGSRRFEIGRHMLKDENDKLQTLHCKYQHSPGSMEALYNNGFKYDLVILDDGLQHSRILRDFHVVMINCLDPPTRHEHLLPRGRLREHFHEALQTADIVVLHNVDKTSVGTVEEIEATVRQTVHHACSKSSQVAECRKSLVLRSRFTASRLTRLTGRRTDEDSQWLRNEQLDLSTRAVYCFAGIANPEGFFLSVKRLSPAVYVGETAFPDHHMYHTRDLEVVLKDLASKPSQNEKDGKSLPTLIVTTEKDVARCGHMMIDFFDDEEVEFCMLGGDLVIDGDTSQLASLCLLPPALQRMLTARPSS